MTSQSRVAIVLAVIAGAMLLIASGGSALSIADRGTSIAITEDPSNAVVGIEGDEQISLTYGSSRSSQTSPVSKTPIFFTITNHFGWEVDVSVSVRGDSNTPPNLQGDPWIDHSQLSSKETASVSGDVVCANQASEEWTFVLTLESEGMNTRVTHSVVVSCDKTVPEGPPSDT